MTSEDAKNIQRRGSRRKALNLSARARTRRRAMARIYGSTSGKVHLLALSEKFIGSADDFREYVFGPEAR